jgi:pseudaminic acid biosynthesis-associated methylase
MYSNEQENFWAEAYAEEYIKKNRTFDASTGTKAWREILRSASEIDSILECGCNIGRNIQFLDSVIPSARKSIIEISKPAFEFVTANHRLDHAFNGSILDSNLPAKSFDMTFTMTVLIHVHPELLIKTMSKLFDYSKKYVLIGEYFNRTPTMIEYQGQRNKLFKMDFGKLFIENFDVTLVDYGFLWGHLYDQAGFDDITWWLFQKR